MNYFRKCCPGKKPRDQSEERRFITPGDPLLASEYCGNKVQSSKYNPLTFLPLNLYEQFHRPINLYFLVVALLQFIPSVAPVSPYTTIFPITVAFSINAVKEAVDDIRRRRQDVASNMRLYKRVHPRLLNIEEVPSQNLHVGDVLLLHPFEIVPCDVVVLITSESEGETYVTTQSLDGESGAKERFAVLRDAYRVATPETPLHSRVEDATASATERTRKEVQDAVRFIFDSSIVIDSEGPNPFLTTYNGVAAFSGTQRVGAAHTPTPAIDGNAERTEASSQPRSSCRSPSPESERRALLDSASTPLSGMPPHPRAGFGGGRKTIPVSADNILLATSCVQNTRFVLCAVVFTGMETKVSMTRALPRIKCATIDRTFNRVTIAIFLFQFILVAAYGLMSGLSLKNHSLWYLGTQSITLSKYEVFLVLPLRYFTMLSPMVPLSFKVMVEISKAYVSSVISWDPEIQHGDQSASANNSALAEDLGQVEYVLSDKTGTLTSNVMNFRALCSSSGFVLENNHFDDTKAAAAQHREYVERSDRFFHLLFGMAFCNTVQRALVERPLNEVDGGHDHLRQWMSVSPDEVAMVEGAARFGMVLQERTRTSGKVTYRNRAEEVRVVKTIPFSSERGRMSVLVQRLTDGVYVLLTKGSDEKVLPRCTVPLTERSADLSRRPQNDEGLRMDAPQGNYTDDSVQDTLRRFSNRGLRTLVFAYRTLKKEQVTSFLDDLQKAEAETSSKDARQEKMTAAYNAMEADLTYCGITAVEDELQDLVPETISQIRNANIKVWMLTGDKMETARQTAVASGLLCSDDKQYILSPPDMETRSAAEQLRLVQDCLRRVTLETSLLEVERLQATRWHWLYAQSGLQEFVEEFLSPYTPEILKPINHVLKPKHSAHMESRLANNAHFRDSDAARIYRLTTPTHGLQQRRGATATPYCLILSGKTIKLITQRADKETMHLFRIVLLHANTVICSRTAPDQKAAVVELAKTSGKVTLAIGDGGNDVAMIQTAQVGVGIKGREGNQASASADFSIHQFRFLSRLLLVHGHTAYHRTAMIVQQSFWKTVLIAWVQMLFNLYTDFSGVSFWDSFSLMLYNAIPTVPVTFLCVMDMPLSTWMLCNNPQLYRMSQQGRYLSATTFYGYVLRALLHGTIVFYLVKWLHEGGGEVLANGPTIDRLGDFYAAYFAVVTIHTYTVLTESQSIMFPHWACFAFSVVSCFWCFAASTKNPYGNQTFATLLYDPKFYLEYIGLLAVVCLSLAVYACVKLLWFPNLLQYQRSVALRIHQKLDSRHVLSRLFQDNNPSQFWRSLSPLHMLLTTPRPVQEGDVRASPSPAVSGDDAEETATSVSESATSVRIRNTNSGSNFVGGSQGSR